MLGDVLQRRRAAQSCVVGLAGGQKMRCLVSCHHLTCIGKDGGGEEAEGVDACVNKDTHIERVGGCVCMYE